jgi:hypothetical protein
MRAARGLKTAATASDSFRVLIDVAAVAQRVPEPTADPGDHSQEHHLPPAVTEANTGSATERVLGYLTTRTMHGA